MKHYVYKTTHIPSGRFYIGLRSCSCLPQDDSYLGSGTILLRLVRKHGVSQFSKQIISCFATRQEASDQEKQLVTSEIIKAGLCLNLVCGGSQAYLSDESRARIGLSGKGRVMSDEARAKLSAQHKGKRLSPEHIAKLKNHKKTPEHCARIVAAKTGKKLTQQHRTNLSKAHIGHVPSAEAVAKTRAKRLGLRFSPEWRAAISAGHKRRNELKRQALLESQKQV